VPYIVVDLAAHNFSTYDLYLTVDRIGRTSVSTTTLWFCTSRLLILI